MICKVYVKKERKKRKDRKKKKDRRERIDARIVEKEDWWGWTSWIGCAIHDLLPRGCARGYVPRYIYSCPVPRAADSISTLQYFERIHTGIFSRHDRLLSRPVSMHCEYNLFCYTKKKKELERIQDYASRFILVNYNNYSHQSGDNLRKNIFKVIFNT